MAGKTGCWFAALALILSVVGPVRGELTDAQVRNAIDRGKSFLKDEQKSNGRWTEHSIYIGGVTALATLALLNSGEDAESPTIQKSLDYLRSLGEPTTVYATSLQTMALCAAQPDQDALQARSELRKKARLG